MLSGGNSSVEVACSVKFLDQYAYPIPMISSFYGVLASWDETGPRLYLDPVFFMSIINLTAQQPYVA